MSEHIGATVGYIHEWLAVIHFVCTTYLPSTVIQIDACGDKLNSMHILSLHFKWKENHGNAGKIASEWKL